MTQINQIVENAQDLPDWFIKRVKTVADDLLKIKAAGFNPIAYSVMICEDTFVFETDAEATSAFEKFEKNGKGENCIQGWWYGKDEFFEKVFPKYVQDNAKFNHLPVFTFLKK